MNEQFCKPLTAYIRQSVNLTENEAELIEKQSRVVTFTKGSLLAEEGFHSRSVYFILSGQARSYYLDEQGKSITWFFHFNESFSTAKNLFVTDYKSLLTNTPGTLTIEALTDITAVQLSFSGLEHLLNGMPAFGTWMRKLNESFFIVIYDRIFTLMTMTAQQRYEQMLHDEPHLLQMFSNHYLASYLGLAPQSLSRIKSTVSHSHLAVAV